MANDFKENSFMTDKSSAKDKSFNNQASTKSSSFSDTSSSRDNPRSNIVDRTYDGTVKWGKDGPDFYDKRGFQDDTAKQKWMDLDSSISADKFFKERNAEKGNTFLERGDSVKSGFFDKVEVGRGERGTFHIDDARVDKLSRNITKNKGKLDKAVNKTHHRMEKVYDREKGTYTFKPVTHNIKSRRNSAKNVSKGKKFVQKRFNDVTRISEGQLGQDENAKQITNAAKFVESGVSRTAFKIYDNSLKSKEQKLNRKANALTKKTNKLADKVSKDGFLLEGRKNFDKAWLEKVKAGDASSNSIKRAFQKNQIKKKYQKDAIKKFKDSKKHGLRALLSRDKATRLRGFNELKKKTIKYLLILVALFLVIVILFGGCAIIFTGLMGGSEIASFSYKATPFEINQADVFYSTMEQKLIDALVHYSDDYFTAITGSPTTTTYTDASGDEVQLVVSYDLGGICHDPNVLIAYLTVLYNDFEFNENDYSDAVISDMMSLFYDCYGVTPKWTANWGADTLNNFVYTDLNAMVNDSTTSWNVQTDPTDPSSMVHYTKITRVVGNQTFYPFRSLEDVVADRVAALPADLQEYYRVLMLSKGMQQNCSGIFGPGKDDVWQEREIIQGYGPTYMGLNDNFREPGWNPNNKDTSGGYVGVAHSNYVQFEVPSAGESFYSTGAGTVVEVNSGFGYEVTIQYPNSNGGSNYLHYSGFSVLGPSISVGSTVSKGTYVGFAHDSICISCETDIVNQTLDSNPSHSPATYVNPFFAID